ncbi:MAG: hypothetical protein K2K53_09260, partial [Oscillospiraceae bacterium]|nr:hypothetical protein [Oscillospiraceae bacterium]
LYLWLTDHEGGSQSMDTPARVVFTTPDETPPVITKLEQQSPSAESSARINFAINEAPATLYWAVVPTGQEASFIRLGSTDEETAEILSTLNNKMKVEFADQAGVLASGNTPVRTTVDTQFTINGLNVEDNNSYTLYYVAKDAAGNYSDRVGYRTIRTRDTKPPTVKYEFTSINGENEMEPLAESGIKLVFSETVKGDVDGEKTFLELYQDYINAQNGEDQERVKATREALGTALSDHILLYYVPMGSDPILLNTAEDDTYGKVNFENAIVQMEGSSMVVFLPGEADAPRPMAVALNSGATYYVQLQGIYDVPMESDPPNPLGDRRGNLKMDNFKVLYAQVSLVANPNIEEIKKEDGATDPTLDKIRLDFVVDVTPKSTAKVPDTECWDMIIWSDTQVEVDI